jgi:hypothetical protein
MMLMFRKSCVVILVVLMLASLTIGSIDPIGTSVSINKTDAAGVRFMEEPGMVSYGIDRAGDNFTTVTLDMAQGPSVNSVMISHRHDMIRPDDYSFISGNMTLHHAGEKDRIYPVQWVRGEPIGLKDGLLMASFIADMNIPMPPMGDGLPPMENMLAFHSVINITSPILSEPKPIVVQADEYNDQISQGQTVWHQQDMTGSSTTLNVSLKWQTASDSLRLMIYTPDGKVLGPYYDSSDNLVNGEINLTISNPDGIASGSWSFKVTGMNVSTDQEGYYLRAW